MDQPALHLASSSARRRDILTALGVSFSYAGVDIDDGPRRVFGIVLFQQSGQEGPAESDTAVLAIHPLPIEIQAGTE